MAFLSVLLMVIFVIVCFLMIVAILLQPGKGEGLGALGGMSTQMFGGGGATTFLSKVTTGLAVAYMILVIVLTKIQQPSAEIRPPEPTPVQTESAPAQTPSATESNGESTQTEAPSSETKPEDASGESTAP